MQEMSAEELLCALKAQRRVRERMVELLRVSSDSNGDLKLADEAQDRVADGVRQLGRELLQSWEQTQLRQTEADLRRSPRIHREG